MTLKPVVIIAIIFSITIVLAGIGIAVMDSTVDNSQVAPAQQMNAESQVEEEEKSEYEATGDTIADDKVVEHTTADESAYYGVPNTNSLSTDKIKKQLEEKMKKQLEEKMRVTYGLVPKGVNAIWVTDSIFFDPKVHDNCSELLPTFDLLGVDKFRIMYATDGVALNCLVRTSEELKARAESIAQQLEDKLLEVKLTERELLEAELLEADAEINRMLEAGLLVRSTNWSSSPSLSDCMGEKPNLYYKHISEKESELERRLVQDPYTGECRYVIVIQNPICQDPANKDRSACR